MKYSCLMKEKNDYDFKMQDAEMVVNVSAELPQHPGRIFLDFLKKAGLDEEPSNKLAKILGISRTAYYDFINEENGISPEMAVRLARFFLEFDPLEYPKAADPYYWWNINNNWLFFYSLKNPKSSVKPKRTGLIRYCVKGNVIRETNDQHNSFSINKEISLDFKEIPKDN